MNVRQTKTGIRIGYRGAQLRFPIRKGRLCPLEIDAGPSGSPLARSLYHLVWMSGAEVVQVKASDRFRLEKVSKEEVRLDVDVSIKGRLKAVLRMVFSSRAHSLVEISIIAEADPAWNGPFAFRCIGLVPGRPTKEVRLCAALYSGWTIGGRTLLLTSCAEEGPRRMAITIEPQEVRMGRGEFADKGPVRCAPLALGYPPALTQCQVRAWEDPVIRGTFAISLHDSPIGDPAHHAVARERDPECRSILPGRYGLRRYLGDYLKFLDHPEMFIGIGDGCGLFHRGFYNCTGRGSFASPGGKTDNRKQFAGALIYRHFAMKERERNPGKYPRMQVFPPYANMAEPLCDMVWGGAHNLQAALFLFRNKALTKKADQIVRATLHFRNTRGEGFQIRGGPAAGAWWNAYQPMRQAFSSRYYEPTVGTPDQGLFAYYLSEIQNRGFVKDPALAKAVEENCSRFLLPRLKPDGLFAHVYDLKGNIGYTREKRRYAGASPCGSLLAALGFLSCYRLTGRTQWKRVAMDTARRVVESYLRDFQWGYLEYDTLGTDTMGMARCLLALCELYREQPAAWLKEAAGLTLRHLVSHQHHRDLALPRYMNNEAAWGGAPSNYGGFVHGYTYNSPQGLGALTLRSDLSEGLLASFETFQEPLAYESLLKYFNHITWHQVIRRDILFGYGSTSEHLNLKGSYVQDTFQVSNAMPFGLDAILGRLALVSSNQPLRSLTLGDRKLTVRFEPAPLLIFSVEAPGADRFIVMRGSGRGGSVSGGEIRLTNYRGESIEVRSRG